MMDSHSLCSIPRPSDLSCAPHAQCMPHHGSTFLLRRLQLDTLMR